MSGALGIASAAIGAASAVSALIGGAPFGMAGAVTLGDFTFQSFEVPARVTFGGQQQMTVHKLPGGQRIIDVMGPDDAPVTWSGIFLGADAADRALQLDSLRIQGDALPLGFGDVFVPQVVIADLALTKGFNRVDYRITCVVLSNGDAQAQPSLAGALLDDLSAATGIDVPDALVNVQSAVSAVTPLVQAVSGPIGGSAAIGISSALSTAQTAISTAQGAAETSLGAAAVELAGPAYGAASALNSAVAAANQLAVLPAMGAFVGRAAVNLAAGAA